MKIHCTIDYVDLENARGQQIPGVYATCSQCGNETETFGTSATSVRRCLALLRGGCPEGARNYYVTDDVIDEL